jgi:hypothetical protein
MPKSPLTSAPLPSTFTAPPTESQRSWWRSMTLCTRFEAAGSLYAVRSSQPLNSLPYLPRLVSSHAGSRLVVSNNRVRSTFRPRRIASSYLPANSASPTPGGPSSRVLGWVRRGSAASPSVWLYLSARLALSSSQSKTISVMAAYSPSQSEESSLTVPCSLRVHVSMSSGEESRRFRLAKSNGTVS